MKQFYFLKKTVCLLLILFPIQFVSFTSSAQLFQFTTSNTGNFEFNVSCTYDINPISIDWGDGTQVSSYLANSINNTVKGTLKGSTVKFYCSVSSRITGFTIINKNLTALDASGHTGLKSITCSENKITSLNLSANTGLTFLDCSSNNIGNIDLSKNTNLTEAFISENPFTSVDLSKNLNLQQLYCEYGKLTSLDLSTNTNLKYIMCKDGNLSSITLPGNSTKLEWLEIQGNRFLLTDLYAITQKISKNICDFGTQQSVLFNEKSMTTGENLDLSSQASIGGNVTVFLVKKGSTDATKDVDYSISEGIIRFLNTGVYTVEMSNPSVTSTSKVTCITGTITVSSGGSGLDTDPVNSIKAFAQNGSIIVEGVSEYQVYTVTGYPVHADQTLPAGIYIVKAGNQIVKVAVK